MPERVAPVAMYVKGKATGTVSSARYGGGGGAVRRQQWWTEMCVVCGATCEPMWCKGRGERSLRADVPRPGRSVRPLWRDSCGVTAASTRRTQRPLDSACENLGIRELRRVCAWNFERRFY